MGNRIKIPPTKKSQPKQLLHSGESEPIEIANNHLSPIRISLIKINLSVLDTLKPSDDVWVEWDTDSYYCIYAGQRIGKVPSSFNILLNAPQNHFAVVIDVNSFPPKILIEVHL